MNIIRTTNASGTWVVLAAQPAMALPGAESEADSACSTI